MFSFLTRRRNKIRDDRDRRRTTRRTLRTFMCVGTLSPHTPRTFYGRIYLRECRFAYPIWRVLAVPSGRGRENVDNLYLFIIFLLFFGQLDCGARGENPFAKPKRVIYVCPYLRDKNQFRLRPAGFFFFFFYVLLNTITKFFWPSGGAVNAADRSSTSFSKRHCAPVWIFIGQLSPNGPAIRTALMTDRLGNRVVEKFFFRFVFILLLYIFFFFFQKIKVLKYVYSA